mgnify:CR=1 FL=1
MPAGYPQLVPVVSELFGAVKRFSRRLDEKKQQKRLADFGDLEHKKKSAAASGPADGRRMAADRGCPAFGGKLRRGNGG